MHVPATFAEWREFASILRGVPLELARDMVDTLLHRPYTYR